MIRPGFRDSAFQPFKREEECGDEKVRPETKTEEQQDCNQAEDSEGDEMVDIERIEDTDSYHALIADATEQNRIVVIKFYASWCRACKAMAPKFVRTAEDWPDIEFHEILFDDNKKLCKVRRLAPPLLPSRSRHACLPSLLSDALWRVSPRASTSRSCPLWRSSPGPRARSRALPADPVRSHCWSASLRTLSRSIATSTTSSAPTSRDCSPRTNINGPINTQPCMRRVACAAPVGAVCVHVVLSRWGLVGGSR